MADDKFFQEEQTAQEELEKIKVGDAEYEPKEVEDYIAKGKRLDDFAKKYNTDPDKAWSAYGKTTQENKTLKEEIEQLKKKEVRPEPVQTDEFSEAQIQQAREQARKIGIVTQGDLDSWYQTRRSAEKMLDECGNYEKDVSGDDGRPKFNTEEILTHMQETGIKNPMKAYKDKYENELDTWKESELNKEKGTKLPTLSTEGTKTVKRVSVTKDNIGDMIKEQLWGSEQ